ncbi:hypothetical protein GCM10027290_55440 [Micromonospora sonneratiae]|uniref:Uncharacterized protein n=1 Tax=Micromonospora sonneratiae TaxID=1184706 RepID=A0ABW3YAS4_9ACTN
MRVELAPEIFSDTDDTTGPYRPEDLHHLYNLLRCFSEQRHDWVTDPNVVYAVQEFLPKHLPQLADTYVALAQDAAVAQAWTGTSQASDVVRVPRADLADFAADLCQAAVVVVENQESDGYFLKTIAHVLGDKRIRIAINQHWIEIANGGGSSLLKVAKEAATRFRRVVRVVAVLDSDRLIPRQRTGSHDKADALASIDVAVHVLDRREAENYVPYRVLARVGRLGEASQRLRLLKQLTPEQRDHYDMKHGFRKAGDPPAVLPAQRSLFHGLDGKLRAGLHTGFGTDLLERMHAGRDGLTEHDFAQLGDGVVAELRMLLATIAGKI